MLHRNICTTSKLGFILKPNIADLSVCSKRYKRSSHPLCQLRT